MPGCGERGKPKAGFPRSPRALGNRSAISTFRSPTAGLCEFETETKRSRTVDRGKVEIQTRDFHFPTAPTACGGKEENHGKSPERGSHPAAKKFPSARLISALENAPATWQFCTLPVLD
jgi:hypothetical protein